MSASGQATLAAQQQALLAALWAPDTENAINLIAAYAAPMRAGGQKRLELGLRAYRAHGRELAPRALAGAYPVMAQLLDEENFGALARAFWLAQPPAAGDLGQWGEGLAGFVQRSEQLADEPYLADVARVEWAMHRAATASDAQVDTASFGLLAMRDPARITLVLAPGVALIPSMWPVVSIANAHLRQEPSLEEAGARLRAGVAEAALVWRDGLRPCVREAVPAEATLVQALLRGASLLDALAPAGALDFNAWLLPAVQQGLVTGARALAED